FNWLGDDGRGARFPYTLRTVPLFRGENNVPYTLRDWKNVQESKGQVKREDYERAINAATYDHCKSLVDSINGAIEEMTKLLGVLNERLGSYASGMLDVRAALGEALVLTKQALSRKTPPAGEAEQAEGEEALTSSGNGAAGGGVSAARARAMVTR